jgi:hypothetical protein
MLKTKNIFIHLNNQIKYKHRFLLEEMSSKFQEYLFNESGVES